MDMRAASHFLLLHTTLQCSVMHSCVHILTFAWDYFEEKSSLVVEMLGHSVCILNVNRYCQITLQKPCIDLYCY